MAILLLSTPGPSEPWLAGLRAALPDADILPADAPGRADEIEVVLMRTAPRGALSGFPNLKLIVCLIAGVEELLDDASVPDVPIVRAGAPQGDAMITEFVLLHVLRHHRFMPLFARAQADGQWLGLKPSLTSERRVGFMGLGNIARPAAERIRDFGFSVAAWTRSPKTVAGIESFHGADGLAPFLERTEILVNLLAATPATENILSREVFERLPEGASVINLGRGQHVVDADLIAALDSGHLEAATLDVFRQEPLPAEHPFWRHPAITITPHAARRILPENVLPQVVENLRRWQAGEPLLQRVDRQAGY